MTEVGMALSNNIDGERRPGAVGVPLPNVEIKLEEEAIEDEPEEESIALDDFEARLQRLRERRLGDN